MPKLIDLFKSLGTKSKLDVTKPETIAFLESIKDTEVPKDVADQIESSLMTVDAAVSNSDVRSRVKAEVLNGHDAFVNGILPDLDLDENVRTEISSERDTAAKIRKTITAVNEKAKKAKKAGDPVTENALKDDKAE